MHAYINFLLRIWKNWYFVPFMYYDKVIHFSLLFFALHGLKYVFIIIHNIPEKRRITCFWRLIFNAARMMIKILLMNFFIHSVVFSLWIFCNLIIELVFKHVAKNKWNEMNFFIDSILNGYTYCCWFYYCRWFLLCVRLIWAYLQ